MNILGKERLKSNCRPEYYEFKTTFVFIFVDFIGWRYLVCDVEYASDSSNKL